MFSMIFILISNLIMKISLILSMKLKMNFEKMSPFECGFDPFNKSRIPFSIRFFLISIIFLIFDVEIALFIPMIITLKTSLTLYWFLSTSLFIFILIMGIIHEWIQGALNWLFSFN